MGFADGGETLVVSLRLQEPEGDPVARQKQELLRRLGVPLEHRLTAGAGTYLEEQAERLVTAARVVALQEEELYFVRGLADPLVPGPWSVRSELQALHRLRGALDGLAPGVVPAGDSSQGLPAASALPEAAGDPGKGTPREACSADGLAPGKVSSQGSAQGLRAASVLPQAQGPPRDACGAPQQGLAADLQRNIALRLRAIVQYPPTQPPTHGMGQQEHLEGNAPLGCVPGLPVAEGGGGPWHGRPLVNLGTSPLEGEGPAEVDLVRWALQGGATTRLIPAEFEGTGRGMMAAEDVEAGEEVMRIPLSLIITPRVVMDSPLINSLQKSLLDARTARLVAASGAAVAGPGPRQGPSDAKRRKEALPGSLPGSLDEETLVLLWTVAEMHDEASLFRPFFRSLPLREGLRTGLSFGRGAMEALEGTLLGPELEHAQQHLKERYSSLFPSLSEAFPELLPGPLFTWHSFRTAAELWYAYGMKLALPVEGGGGPAPEGSCKQQAWAQGQGHEQGQGQGPGPRPGQDEGQQQETGAGATKLSSCLVPLASLLNHSVYPHITHYSTLERWQGGERSLKGGHRALQQTPLSFLGSLDDSRALKSTESIEAIEAIEATEATEAPTANGSMEGPGAAEGSRAPGAPGASQGPENFGAPDSTQRSDARMGGVEASEGPGGLGGPGLGEPCVVLRAARPCPRGRQCFLFYGPLSSAHQLLFYGFLAPAPERHPNPYDAVPIDLSPEDDPKDEAVVGEGEEVREGGASGALTGTTGEAGEPHDREGSEPMQVVEGQAGESAPLTPLGVLRSLGLGPAPFAHHLRACGAHLDPSTLLLSWDCPCSHGTAPAAGNGIVTGTDTTTSVTGPDSGTAPAAGTGTVTGTDTTSVTGPDSGTERAAGTGTDTGSQQGGCRGCATWGALPSQLLLAVSALCMGEGELRQMQEDAPSFSSVAHALRQVPPETLLAAIEALEGMLHALMGPLAPQEAAEKLPGATGPEADRGAWDLGLVEQYKVSQLRILESAQKCLEALKREAIAALL